MRTRTLWFICKKLCPYFNALGQGTFKLGVEGFQRWWFGLSALTSPIAHTKLLSNSDLLKFFGNLSFSVKFSIKQKCSTKSSIWRVEDRQLVAANCQNILSDRNFLLNRCTTVPLVCLAGYSIIGK